MAAENRALEIVGDPALPAPAQSAEPPNTRGFRALCQFHSYPLISLFRAHAYISRRYNDNRLLRRIIQWINFVAAIHRQSAPAEKKEGHVGSQARGNFQESRQRDLFLSRSQHPDQGSGSVA